MRILLAVLLLMGGLPAAQAQTRVYGVDLLRAGTYELGKFKKIDDADISTGHRYEAPATFLRRTTTIPAKVDVVFGLDVMIRGRPRGKIVPFRVIWRYPEPGLRNPDTGKTKMVDDYVKQEVIGKKTYFNWSLGEEWVVVPGVWTFEIWYEGRKLASQSFTLVKE